MAVLMKGGQGVQCNFLILAFVAVLVLSQAVGAYAERLKDIASIGGVRENQLIGYGLVVGLNGTGDKGDATLQTIVNMLSRMGVTVNKRDIKAKNAAAVMVTATLPPFPKIGNRIDAIVSTIADSKSLQGGTLLLTPMKGVDGNVYGLSQGPVSIGGFAAGGGGTTTQKNHPTVGKVPEGMNIEKEIGFDLAASGEISIYLHNPDFSTASAASGAINRLLGDDYAAASDPAKVVVHVPEKYRERVVEFISLIEAVDVAVDIQAKVIINERTGTVVIGKGVAISPVAISHGNLTIEIATEQQVSQPPSFAPESSRTVVTPRTDVNVVEQKGSLAKVSGVTLEEVISSLNALGVTPRDLISILQALKAAGALKAELEII